MGRPSRKKPGDGPTAHDGEDLACQGKLPRNTTIAEDIAVAPRSASKTNPFHDIDGDEKKVTASSSKIDEGKSEKPTRKRRGNVLPVPNPQKGQSLIDSIAAPDTALSDNKSSALRSSRKRPGDFNDDDGEEFESVAIDDIPTETKTAKSSKKRKTTKGAAEAPIDDEVETEKIFPGGDRVEAEPATSSKRGRKPGKKVEKSETLPIESAKSSRKTTGSKSSGKVVDGEKQPATSNDEDEEPAVVPKDQPKRRGRPRKSQVESKSDELPAEPTGIEKSISANKATQGLPKAGRSKRSSNKELTATESTPKASASKESASKEPALTEPVEEDSATKKPVAKESLKKEPSKKEPAKRASSRKEPPHKEPAQKEPPKKESAKKEPPKKEPVKKEPAKKVPNKKEPTKEESAKKDLDEKQPTGEEPPENEPATKASSSKTPASKASASKASASKASAPRPSATKKSTLDDLTTEEPVTEEPTAQEYITEKVDTAELAATKPAPKPSKRVNKGEKAEKAVDAEAPATIKTSRGKTENKAKIVAESSKDVPRPKVSKKAGDSSKKDDATKGTQSKSSVTASSSKDIDQTGAEAPERAENDGVTSTAANSKKRKTPPGADPGAIRKIIDPLTELESTKKKQKKGLTSSLDAAKAKIGDLVSPIVDTVTQGVHTAKDLAAEVQSSILEDVASVAEEATDTKLDEAKAVKDPGPPAAKNGKDKGKDASKGKEKGKERVRALSKEVEPAQTSAGEGVAPKAPEADLGTKKQDVLGYQRDIEIADQPQTNLTGLDNGTKESANIVEASAQENPHRSNQPTVLEITEVTGISTVVTTVVQGVQP